MRRRCLAMDIAGLCSYEAAALWWEILKAAYLSEHVPGYSKVTWLQMLNADKALFIKVAELTALDGVKAKPGKTVTEFQAAWTTAIMDADVRVFLQRLPVSSAQASSSSSPAVATTPTTSSESAIVKDLKRKLQAAEARASNANNQVRQQGKATGKGKPTKKGRKGREVRIPVEMQGLRVEDDNKEPLCWSYNMKVGCQKVQPGQKCDRGWHICAKCPGRQNLSATSTSH